METKLETKLDYLELCKTIDSLQIPEYTKKTVKRECIKQSNKNDVYFIAIDHLVYMEIVCSTGFSCSFATPKAVIK